MDACKIKVKIHNIIGYAVLFLCEYYWIEDGNLKKNLKVSSNKSLGLGLALSKSAILMHGGMIDVNSRVDKGSEFIVKLPIDVLRDK